MWTNIYRIGGLHQVSWFQFLPNESELTQLPEKSRRSTADQKDCLGTRQVLLAHLQLQNEGFLSTWTNSFVGPWDPSQGLHNPDEKIKLWFFLPGRHTTVVDAVQPYVSTLRVVASGVWLAPGDCEEVAVALSQALQYRIEKALVGYSFLRYGDVFTKFHPNQSDTVPKNGQPTLEILFGAAEDGFYVHVIISAKQIRTLSSSDMENVQKQLSRNSNFKLPVVVSPHGLSGWLTGNYPNDLVKQIFISSGMLKASNGIIGLPHHIPQGTSSKSWGQSYFAEVVLGCHKMDNEKESQSAPQVFCNVSKTYVTESGVQRSCHSCKVTDHRKSFVYPVETVIIPVQQPISSRSSLKRFWLQNSVGSSFAGSSVFMHCDNDCLDGNWSEIFGQPIQNDYNSSSNSNTSSISSLCSSSDSDQRMTSKTGELEADADSLSCRQSSLSSNYQFDFDGQKLGSKRSRTAVAETFGQSAVGSVQDSFKSDFGSMDANNSTITMENELVWGDRNVYIDIHGLLSEFGEFGGFFETEKLDLGEPPGTAESQVPMFSPSEYDAVSSPAGAMDSADPMLLPMGFPPLEGFNHSIMPSMEDPLSKNYELTGSTYLSGSSDYTASTGDFEHLIKAEALMTFAPEYGAVETCTSNYFSSIFRTPYCPKSNATDSSSSTTKTYTYGAIPPCVDMHDEKSGMIINLKTVKGRLDAKKYYNHVESKRDSLDKRSFHHVVGCDIGLSSVSNVPLSNVSKFSHIKISDSVGSDNIFISSKTKLATEIECLMFQACMCRIRHLHLSSDNGAVWNTSKIPGSKSNALHQFSGDVSIISESTTSKYEMRKKDSIPVRIAGEVDAVLESHSNAPVGVWRTVGVPKVTKAINPSNVEVSSLPHHAYTDEGLLSYGQRLPLQELLYGLPLLVQQATSFVDVGLDGCCNDGPFSWLAMQEQLRRGFCCGPSSVHAGCGGTLASSHFLDVAGVELVDPFHTEILASTVIGLLQSEIKTALKAAFKPLEGPLSVNDWFKGRNSSVDGNAFADGSATDSTLSECKDSSFVSPGGESLSPAQSSLRISSASEKGEESSQRPTPLLVPPPAMLFGYQDDWLKTSANSLQFWEKAPFEPYALPKPITYFVVCPEIDPLTTSSADFFQQLGTMYETCKLGTHSPQNLASEMEADGGKLSSSGFVLLDCPQSMKIESSNATLVGSLSDYFLSLSNGWDLESYLKSLSKAIRSLKLPTVSTNAREGNTVFSTVVYVVCPFPDPIAVLQTIVESSIALGSVFFAQDKERKSSIHSQVGRALNCSPSFDESFSNVIMLSGFSVSKLVLQIVTVDTIFRVSPPTLNEPIALKEIAFTVYNKARRICKGSLNDIQFSTLTSRPSHLLIPQIGSVSGIWKDCISSRMGSSREGEMDSSLRPGSWDNTSWQYRTGGLTNDQTRNGDYFFQEDIRYMFEPLFILSQPGSLGQVVPSDDNEAASSTSEAPDDPLASLYQKSNPSLHCCYGWTEDWRWLVCVWTDARGELLDSNIFPFGGISSRQDTKGLQCVFLQILQQGHQILHSSDSNVPKPRDLIVSRIGNFFELEYLEWQKAIYAVGGSDIKKWPVQLRRPSPDSPGGTSQESLPITPMYSVTKTSNFMKNSIGQQNPRKHMVSGHIFDNTRGIFQSIQSITFASISVDHSLQLVLPSDNPSVHAKSIGDTPLSYLLAPSNYRLLSPGPMQLPTCLTAESPPLAHLLHSRGSAIPISSGFVASKAVAGVRSKGKEEWPSVVCVSLVDYYGGTKGIWKQDGEMPCSFVLESLIAELHALSWMTSSPFYLDRRTPLPFHCDMVLRLTRILHFADKYLSSNL